MTKYDNGYVHHVAKNAKPEPGFREYFEYRDLELGDVTNGATFAQVITAKKAVEGGTGHHAHNVRFHWTYVIKGWVSFDFRDVGHVKMEPGDCHYMPEGCHHELMACSDDLEMIEMYSPGEIGEVEIPEWRQ